MVSVPIDRVRVYSRGATVFRRATLAGDLPGVLEIPGLPLSLQDATVRVRSLTDGVVAGAVRIGLHAKPPEQTPDTPDEAALRAVERRIEKLDRRLQSLEAEVEVLRGLEVPARPRGKDGKPPPASPMRARVALDQFADAAIQERLDEARTLRRDRSRAAEEAAALRDAVRRASLAKKARPDAITKVVLVDLSGAAKDAVLELEYFVPGARWAPQYQCDIARDGSAATLKLRALVCQASGEDWRSVALELSTAEPQAFTELPKLASVRIGKAQPAPLQRGYREPPKGAGSLYADFDRDWARLAARIPHSGEFQVHAQEIEPPEPADEVFGAAVGGAAYDADDMELEEDDLATETIAFAASAVADLMEEERGEPAPAKIAPPPAPPRMRSAAPGKPQAAKKRKMAREVDGFLADAEEPTEAFGTAPSVAFAQLRLPAPGSGQRGKLRPVAPLADYLALLGRSGLDVDFDVAQVVRAAIDRASAAGRQALPGGAVDVRQAAGQFDYAYRADDRVDVPSDLSWASIPLGTREAACVVTYVVVPRVDTNVFRVASVLNPSSEPLLSGPVEVYVGGEYVLSTRLPTVAPRERFELGLGVEQALRCARNTRFREERSGQNVVAMAELHHEIDIELHNPLARTVQCEVRERIPQPDRDAEVDVEELGAEPPWEVWDQVDIGPKLVGGRRWTVQVPAGGSSTLHAHYVVKIYANNEVVGGNRREA